MREIGFRKPTVAPVTDNTEETYTAGELVRLGRGLECKIDRKQDKVEWESDDTVEKVIYGDPAYDVTITINELTDKVKCTLFGGEIIKGVYVPPANSVPQEVAYIDEVLRDDGTYKKRCLYVGTFSLPSDDNKTKTKKPDSKGVQLKGTFYRRLKDGLPEITLDGAEPDRDKELEKAWFTKVPEPPQKDKTQE
ncbi:major tail protein [Clostridium botulinum]|uniref:major tail protein n=1 Tax=Clostridium botulinum TaxID=1491 RepID=UPI00339D9C97